MPSTPPIGGPALAVASDPPTTADAAVPIDAREWRIRTESRCNAIATFGLALVVLSALVTTLWLGVASFTLAIVLIIASFWLRPTLPWRAPVRREIDPADLAALRPPTAPLPAMPAEDWRAMPVPATAAYGQAAVNGAPRLDRNRRARPTFPPVR